MLYPGVTPGGKMPQVPRFVVADPMAAAVTPLAALAAAIAWASVQVDEVGVPASVTNTSPASADAAISSKQAMDIRSNHRTNARQRSRFMLPPKIPPMRHPLRS